MLVLLLGALFFCRSFFLSISKDAKWRVAVRNSLCISNMIGLVKNRPHYTLCAELMCTYSTQYLVLWDSESKMVGRISVYVLVLETREHLIG